MHAMDGTKDKEIMLDPADFPAFPPTDESGDVDLTLIDAMLELTPGQRLRQHDEFNQFFALMRDARIKLYGFDPADEGSLTEID